MRLTLLLLLIVAWGLPSTVASAAELYMFRRAGCPWCAAWDREIGPAYDETEIGRRTPLRMVDIYGEQPPIALKGRIIYTPTFVLVEKGREVGRIEGYPGDEFFWALLEGLLQQLPAEDADDSSKRITATATVSAFRN
jgi:thioredoxin-related protein